MTLAAADGPAAGQLRVLGLDLSLTSTGAARFASGPLADGPETFLVRSAKKGVARIDAQAAAIGQAVRDYDPDLVTVEGPGYYSAAQGAYWHENAGLWWAVVRGLWRTRRPYAVVPPSVLKKYATGKGGADKTAMVVAAVRRFGLEEISADEADALWLAAAGLQHYGVPGVRMPAEQAAVLEGVVTDRKTKTSRPVVPWPATLARPVPAAVLSTGSCTYPRTGGHTHGEDHAVRGDPGREQRRGRLLLRSVPEGGQAPRR